MKTHREIMQKIFGSGMLSNDCYNTWYCIVGEPDNEFNYKCDERYLLNPIGQNTDTQESQS